MSSTAPAVVPHVPHPVPGGLIALAGRAHHRALRLADPALLRRVRAGERGQGTVEYVALAMLIAAVMAGVVIAAGGLRGGGIAQAVVEKVKSAIGTAGAAPKGAK